MLGGFYILCFITADDSNKFKQESQLRIHLHSRIQASATGVNETSYHSMQNERQNLDKQKKS